MTRLKLPEINMEEFHNEINKLEIENKIVEKNHYGRMPFSIDIKISKRKKQISMSIKESDTREFAEEKIENFRKKLDAFLTEKEVLNLDLIKDAEELFGGKDNVRVRKGIMVYRKKPRRRWGRLVRVAKQTESITRIYLRYPQDALYVCEKMRDHIVAVGSPFNQAHMNALHAGRNTVFRKKLYYDRFRFKFKFLKVPRNTSGNFGSEYGKAVGSLIYDNMEDHDWAISYFSINDDKPTKKKFIREYLDHPDGHYYWPMVLYLNSEEVYTMLKLTIEKKYIAEDNEVILLSEI